MSMINHIMGLQTLIILQKMILRTLILTIIAIVEILRKVEKGATNIDSNY